MFPYRPGSRLKSARATQRPSCETWARRHSIPFPPSNTMVRRRTPPPASASVSLPQLRMELQALARAVAVFITQTRSTTRVATTGEILTTTPFCSTCGSLNHMQPTLPHERERSGHPLQAEGEHNDMLNANTDTESDMRLTQPHSECERSSQPSPDSSPHHMLEANTDTGDAMQHTQHSAEGEHSSRPSSGNSPHFKRCTQIHAESEHILETLTHILNDLTHSPPNNMLNANTDEKSTMQSTQLHAECDHSGHSSSGAQFQARREHSGHSSASSSPTFWKNANADLINATQNTQTVVHVSPTSGCTQLHAESICGIQRDPNNPFNLMSALQFTQPHAECEHGSHPSLPHDQCEHTGHSSSCSSPTLGHTTLHAESIYGIQRYNMMNANTDDMNAIQNTQQHARCEHSGHTNTCSSPTDRLTPLQRVQRLWPSGWVVHLDPESRRLYYQHTLTQHTQWEPPRTFP